MTDLIRQLGPLAFASRLRRLSDQLSHDVSKVYKDHEADFEARWFPVARLLTTNSPIAVTEVADALGYTHPAVSQIAAAMEKRGLVRSKRDKSDERRRLLSLTARGEATIKQIAPVWLAIRDCTEELIVETGSDLLGTIAEMEESLRLHPMRERIRARLTPGDHVEIIGYRPSLRAAFEALNREWLGPILPLEDNDRRILRDPHKSIIREGGQVLFAQANRKSIGTVAVIRQRPGVYEIAKMAVTASARGRGIGRKLATAAIAWAKQADATEIRIATSPKLKPAVALYKSLGFELTDPDPAWRSEYRRKTIFLTLNDNKKP